MVESLPAVTVEAKHPRAAMGLHLLPAVMAQRRPPADTELLLLLQAATALHLLQVAMVPHHRPQAVTVLHLQDQAVTVLHLHHLVVTVLHLQDQEVTVLHPHRVAMELPRHQADMEPLQDGKGRIDYGGHRAI